MSPRSYHQSVSSSGGRVPTHDADDNPAIATHYGKTSTMSAIEHRFRPVRKQAECVRLAVARGDDPEEIDILDTGGMEHLDNISTVTSSLILDFWAFPFSTSFHIIHAFFLNLANIFFSLAMAKYFGESTGT